MHASGGTYFPFRSTLCGFNLTLQYPQPQHFPTLNGSLPFPSSASAGKYDAKFTKRGFTFEVHDRLAAKLRERGGTFLEEGERLRARDVWKRDLAGRPNGTIDPWYQCDLLDEMVSYAINFTFPWCEFPFLCILFARYNSSLSIGRSIR